MRAVNAFSRLFLFSGFKNDELTSGESTLVRAEQLRATRLSGETTCYHIAGPVLKLDSLPCNSNLVKAN